jgi:hypothetical protein
MPSINSRHHEQPSEDFHEVLTDRCYHEAAHAVFACHDGTEVDKVWVSGNEGACTIYRADLYERYKPWRYARYCLAGAYAGYLACTLKHPELEDFSLSHLHQIAERIPEGDAWWVVEILEDFAAAEDFLFKDVEEAYVALFSNVGEQIEVLWDAIEAVAFALWDRYWESGEEKLGCLAGSDVTSIVKSTHGEASNA